MFNTERLVLDLTTDTAWRPGIDDGRKPIRVVKINRARTLAVVRIPGGTHWVGIGLPRAYHSQMTVVYDITELKPRVYDAGTNAAQHGMASHEVHAGIATKLIDYEGR